MQRQGKHPRDSRALASQPLDAEVAPAEGGTGSATSSSDPQGSVHSRKPAVVDPDPGPVYWTKWSIGSSLQILRNGSPAASLKELRKLHLRWWHAGTKMRQDTLGAAGLPNSILEACRHVVQTCKVCRCWQQPGRQSTATTTLATRFGQFVETDTPFLYKSMVAHYVDRATRYHAGVVVPDKTEDTLWYAFRNTWLTQLGTPETVVTDGEAALVTARNRARFAAHNIQLSVRAPGQHAHYAERHGATLRHVVHVLVEQLKIENREEPVSSLVLEAFFALNALSHYEGTTPAPGSLW